MTDELSVLLIEDNPGDARLIRELLARDGGGRFRLQIADHLAAGLAHLDPGGFDAVLLDLDLPDSQGLATLTQMLAHSPHMPVIVLTGLDDEALAVQAVGLGAQDYLIKGQVDASPFARSIRYAIGRKRAEEALRASESKYRTLVATLSEGMSLNEAIYDDHGDVVDYRILEVNPAFDALADFDGPVIGSVATQLFGMSPEFIRTLWPEQRQSGASTSTQYASPLNGRCFAICTSPIVNDRFVTSFFDITDRQRDEQALSESEQLLRAILDATPFPIALVDLQDNDIEFWSRSALTLFGHIAPTAAEWYQKAYPDPDYRREVIERWQPAVEEARRSGQTVNAGEYRITCSDGSVRLCELFVAFCAGRLLVTFSDITERRQAEQALRHEQVLLRTVIDNLPDAIYAKDRQGRKILTNHADANNVGLAEAEVLGKTNAELFPPDIAAGFEADDQTVLGGVQPLIDHEELLVNQQGRRLWLRTSKLPLRDAAGQIVGLVGIGRDITAAKQMEDTLRASEARFRAIFEHASDAVLLDGADDEILEVNSRLCDLMGYSREELLRMRISDLQAPEVRGQPGSVVNSELARHGSTAFEALNLHRSGRRIPVEVTVARVEGVEGDMYVSIVRDITERKQAEAKVAAQLVELRCWQTTILGRETRILDLKREVNEALAQVGQPQRYPSAARDKP